MTDSNASELEPCPCCGVDLIGGTRDNPDNAGDFFYYHPHNHCILQNVGVWPHNVASWNTRPAITPQQAAKVLELDYDKGAHQGGLGASVEWQNVFHAMNKAHHECGWADWPEIFSAALRDIAEQEGKTDG